MINDKIYMCLNDDFKRIRSALSFNDVSYAISRMKKIKMKKQWFLTLCKDAIDADNIYKLQVLLDIYSAYWRQDIFNELIDYVLQKKKLQIIPFFNEYIDKVNKHKKEMNDWNTYIKAKKEIQQQIEEENKKSKFQKFILKIKIKIYNLIKKK